MPAPPALRLVPDITLLAGETKEVPLQVDHAGAAAEFLQVKVDGLPGTVSVKPVRIVPPENSAYLELTVRLLAAAEEKRVMVSLWDREKKLGQQPLKVTVLKRALPTLLPPAAVSLRPGEARSIAFRIKPNKSQDAVEMRLERMPADVKLKAPVVVKAGEDTATLTLVAGPEAAPAKREALLSLWCRGVSIDALDVPISVEKPGEIRNPKSETQTPKAETPTPKAETRNLKTGDRPNQPGSDPPPTARRTPPASERVDIPTGDGVMLHGRFYPGPEGTKSNGVLLVPDLAMRSAEEAYGELARALQNKGLAVLTFDFRGHNQSLAVQPLFWKLPHNLVLNKGTKPGPKADQLRYMDIPVTYFPHMVNDIMAARTYLELRNDKHELNASNLVVVVPARERAWPRPGWPGNGPGSNATPAATSRPRVPSRRAARSSGPSGWAWIRY